MLLRLLHMPEIFTIFYSKKKNLNSVFDNLKTQKLSPEIIPNNCDKFLTYYAT